MENEFIKIDQYGETLPFKNELWKRGLLFACLLLLLFCSGMMVAIWTQLSDVNNELKRVGKNDEVLVKEIRAKFDLNTQEELDGNKNEIKR